MVSSIETYFPLGQRMKYARINLYLAKTNIEWKGTRANYVTSTLALGHTHTRIKFALAA